MLSFKTFSKRIDEALLTFGGREARFGQVVIMAGGAGSGKGFVKDFLVGLNGRVFDPDELKKWAMKKQNFVPLLQPVFDELYKEGRIKIPVSAEKIANDDKALKNPEYVTALHLAAKKLKWDTNEKNQFFNTLPAFKANLPNIIFDTVLATPEKANNLVSDVLRLGYEPKNIHIVWVINSFEVAIKQNNERSRTVSYEVMVDTHTGAAQTMRTFIKNAQMPNGADGFLYLVFNNAESDATWRREHRPGKPFQHPTEVVPDIDKDTGKQKIDPETGKPQFKPKPITNSITFARYIRLKERGKAIDIGKLTKDIEDRIKKYVPKGSW